MRHNAGRGAAETEPWEVDCLTEKSTGHRVGDADDKRSSKFCGKRGRDRSIFKRRDHPLLRGHHTRFGRKKGNSDREEVGRKWLRVMTTVELMHLCSPRPEAVLDAQKQSLDQRRFFLESMKYVYKHSLCCLFRLYVWKLREERTASSTKDAGIDTAKEKRGCVGGRVVCFTKYMWEKKAAEVAGTSTGLRCLTSNMGGGSWAHGKVNMARPCRWIWVGVRPVRNSQQSTQLRPRTETRRKIS